jgi:hypothetical protein
MASFKGPKDWFPLRSAVPIKATCTFGTSVTISQIALLRVLVKKFDQAYVLFDEGADGPANNLVDWIGAKRAYLPWNVKDPGEITPVEMVEYTSPDFFGEPNFTRASLLMSNFAKSTLLRRVQSKRHKP